MASFRADSRGVSESLGFVLIFSMVILSIVLVSVTGYAGLAHIRDAERVNNAETAFDVFAANVDDLVAHGAPSRSTEIKLDEASLSIGEPVVEVVVYQDDGSTSTFELRPFVYDGDTEAKLVYVNGAVIREDRGGVVMLRGPDVNLTTDGTPAFTIINLKPAQDTQSVGGSPTVNVRTTRTESNLFVAKNVTFEITASHSDAGERYLDELVAHGCSIDGEKVSCTGPTDRIYVTVVETDVRFD